MLNKNTLVVFGDSNVWGAELKDAPNYYKHFKSVVYDSKDTNNWPYHLRYSFSGLIAERFNMKILNLSIPGSSNDTIFRRVNKFVQGHYPVILDDCLVLIFWTGISRREFFNDHQKRYYNYLPKWSTEQDKFLDFHNIYCNNLWNENYDLIKTFNYAFSLDALLKYYKIEYRQGFSLPNKNLSKLLEKNKMKNCLSYDPDDSIFEIITKKYGLDEKNPYMCPEKHPNELGHQLVADKIIKLIINE